MRIDTQGVRRDVDIAYDFSAAGVVLVVRIDEGSNTDLVRLYMSPTEAREEAQALLAFAQMADDRKAAARRDTSNL